MRYTDNQLSRSRGLVYSLPRAKTHTGNPFLGLKLADLHFYPLKRVQYEHQMEHVHVNVHSGACGGPCWNGACPQTGTMMPPGRVVNIPKAPPAHLPPSVSWSMVSCILRYFVFFSRGSALC